MKNGWKWIAALVGLGLVGLGFRQRIERPGFGMSLQGGGLAALYLVTFLAFKFYSLVPASLAFGLFVGLAVATAENGSHRFDGQVTAVQLRGRVLETNQ